MRLLFLTETIPYPPDSGGRIKTYHTLRMLSQEHEVHCHALVRDEARLRFEPDLARVCSSISLHLVKRHLVGELWTALVSTLSRIPFVVRRHFHRQVLEQLRAATRRLRFDAVYCDHLSMVEYGRRLGLPIVLDAHNVEFEIVRRHADTLGWWSPARLFAAMEWRRLERYERQWYPGCRLIFAVSDVDARTISAFAGTVPVVVVPISVDLAGVPPRPSLVRDPEILFVGGLHWPPNADAVDYFIKDIFPVIRTSVPDARVTVVGAAPRRVARRFDHVPGVRLVGHVDDVEGYFSASRVMVVPIRSGSGMRVKILDALARQLLTVTTSIGCEGIDVVPGTHLLVGDTPLEFARLVTQALRDDGLTAALAKAGRELVAERYDIPVVALRVLRSFHQTFPSQCPMREPLASI
jgi:polysaccharide biosynthesis protein PslH